MNLPTRSSMRRFACGLFAASVIAAPAQAYQLNNLGQASDSQFHDLTADLLSALGSKGLPGPVLGENDHFGIAGYASTTQTHDSSTWSAVTGSRIDHIDVAGAEAWYDLPHDVRVNFLASEIGNTDDSLWRIGASLPVTLLRGWRVDARGSVGAVWSVKNLDIYTENLGFEATRAYDRFVPYAGAGLALGQFHAAGENAPANQDPVRPQAYIGLRWNLRTFSIGGVIDQTGRDTSLGIRLAVGL